jgi:hypothetical protein
MARLDEDRARLLGRASAVTGANKPRRPARSDNWTDLAAAYGSANGLAASTLFWAVLIFVLRHWVF